MTTPQRSSASVRRKRAKNVTVSVCKQSIKDKMQKSTILWPEKIITLHVSIVACPALLRTQDSSLGEGRMRRDSGSGPYIFVPVFQTVSTKKKLFGGRVLCTPFSQPGLTYSSSGLYDLNKVSPLSALGIGWKCLQVLKVCSGKWAKN